jgi:hypothetical protein
VGEATPAMTMWAHQPDVVAERVSRTIPDVRLIALLRNPVDRTRSAVIHHVRNGTLPPDTRPTEYVRSVHPVNDPSGIVTGGWYAASLRPYIERFGDQLLVLLHDDVRADPDGVYARVLEHVGASAGFRPDHLDALVYSNDPSVARETAHGLTADERRDLYRWFHDDLERLETLIGRDLSAWVPNDASPPWRMVPTEPGPGRGIDDLLAGQTDWIADVLAGVTPDVLGRPGTHLTLKVRDRVAHLVNVNGRLAAALDGVDYEEIDVDALDGCYVDAYRASAERFAGARAEAARRPIGPATDTYAELRHAAVQVFVSQIGHGWTLAAATGHDPAVPEEWLAVAERFPNGADVALRYRLRRGGVARA